MNFLVEELSKFYNKNETDLIIEGLKVKRKTTFRINYIKNNVDNLKSELNKNKVTFSEYKKLDGAFIVDEIDDKADRLDDLIKNLDIYENGKIYVQNLSSMLPVLALEPKENDNILDMCASPGGKTTMIQSITNNRSNLTAVEIDKIRFSKLKYNVKKQGANVFLMNTNSILLDDMLKFDKILLDAPCSGSGILDLSNDKYKKNFTKQLIDNCVLKQKKLIKKAYNLLNKDGILVYSTCSVLNYENEEMVEYAKKLGFKQININLNIDKTVSDNMSIKIFPDSIFEGFFIAKFVKT